MRAKYQAHIRKIAVIILLAFPSNLLPKRPLNLTIAKNEVIKYYTSGRYEKDLKKIVNRAIKHFKKVRLHEKQTIIFDIDNTILSTFPLEKSVSFGCTPFHKWALEARAPVIPEVKRLYDYLVNQGFKIVFLTSRKYNEYDATIKNLKREGIITFDKLIVRQPHELKIKTVDYKSSCRKELTEQGYNIVGTIGDQQSDLDGPHAGYRVKIPNYLYISLS